MITFGRPQSARSSLSNSATAQSRAVHVDFPGMSVTRFENLQVTDIIQSRPVLVLGKAGMKFMVIM